VDKSVLPKLQKEFRIADITLLDDGKQTMMIAGQSVKVANKADYDKIKEIVLSARAEEAFWTGL